jgi:TP901 family phage tail tape measure protein
MLGLGSTTQLGIGIAIKLHDQFSNTAMKVNQQLVAMRKNANSALTGAMKDYRNNAMMVAASAAGVSIGMFRMVEAASEYDHLINQITIVGGKHLGKTRQELSAFAQEMSMIFPNNPRQIAGAMFENVKAGVTEGLDLITKYQIAVSTATNEAIDGEQGVAAGLLGIMNAMDMTIDQFPRIANATSQAANISMASVNSINESMQYFANTAHLAGLNVEETLALVARLSQANIRGSIAGTALSNMIRHATSSVGIFQSPKNEKAWAGMGVDTRQIVDLINNGRWFDLIDVVDKATRTMDRHTKLSLLDQIFGVRGNKALVNMFGSADPTKTFRAMYEAIRQGVNEDIAMKQAEAMSDDTWSDIKKIGNALRRFGIQFLEAAKPTIRVLLGIATRVINVFNAILSSGIGRVIAGLAVVAAPLIAIMFAFRAAVLTATIAMRGFAMSSAVGGFGGLLRGGLGQVGIGRFGQYGGQFMRNSAGRMVVRGGQTVNFGGKVYKGGQVLPTAFATAMGTTAFAAKGASFFSTAGPWLSRIVGFGARWLPVIGGVWLAVDLLKGIFGFTKKTAEKPVLDPLFQSYYRNLDQQLFGVSQTPDFYNRHEMSYGQLQRMQNPQPLNQTINLNVDGTNAQSVNIQQLLEDQVNNTMDFEIPL